MDQSLTTDGFWAAPKLKYALDREVVIPGSKSATARALVVAALADGPSSITGGLDARDTLLMRDALRALGVQIHTSFHADPKVDATFGAGADDAPLTSAVWRVRPPLEFTSAGDIDCGLAGTVLRFVTPIAAMAHGRTRIHGDEAMAARPIRPLLDALVDIGAGIPDDAYGVPFTITGRPDLPGGPVIIDSSSSSQFVSGLLLSAARFHDGLDLRHVGPTLPSLPHIQMTVDILRDHGVVVEQPDEYRWVVAPGPIRAGDIAIEPDLSTAAPFLCAAVISDGTIRVPHWPLETNQPGALLLPLLEQLGSTVDLRPDGAGRTGTLSVTGPGHWDLPGFDVDLSDASELTPVVSVLGALASGPSRIRGVGHIRGHETDRLQALEDNFRGLGAKVDQTEDGLVFRPSIMHGGPWGAYADHRLAQAGALLGLVVSGVMVDDIVCTSKTMPSFPAAWQSLATGTGR
ncbi:3-phosphoshikimate 1-carboxyvinyltransferase [Raineyella antarctica]|uniref:3-phosphoshikimate 1-carboxyvinyltransferase n=1 Tax=Raineyella antarctica TaxID=1577474 RepID=A0A1G6GVT1_9ACTN|nr:3-phosphoshikimate 1-carboxyvinyltransferase [Raineyella antarctica]SDB85785.1 3-phosphoshikimate 1-carboxyvinyltransferase [Raineyella antarctica]